MYTNTNLNEQLNPIHKNIGPTSFSTPADVYVNSSTEPLPEEVDEENWHVGVLCARIFAIILLLVIIVLFALGSIYSTKLLILAGIVSVLMIIVIVASFYEFRCCKCLTTSYVFKYNSSMIDRPTIVRSSMSRAVSTNI